MISILLPTYNQAEFLPAALAGLAAQTYRGFEVIACDDGSTDATAEILNAHCIRTVEHQLNRGTAVAINSAAHFASGDFWTWVSSDNVMEPDWLETLIGAMAEDVGAVYSAFWYEKDSNSRVEFTAYEPSLLVSREACYIGPSFLIRADIWRKAGDHRGAISHDFDHWLRVEETCWREGLKIIGIPKPLCHYNAHDKRVTITRRHEYDAPHWQLAAMERRCE